jgi:hypothetical protein
VIYTPERTIATARHLVAPSSWTYSRPGDRGIIAAMTSIRRALVVAAAFLAACRSSSSSGPAAPDPGPGGPSCAELGLPVAAFVENGTGTHRGEVAGDFTVPLVGGGEFNLRRRWSGCDVYAFVPDTISISEREPASVWTRDLDLLLQGSPRNAHYFFVSRQAADAGADLATSAMKARIDDLLGTLAPGDAASWRGRLHVVAGRAGTLAGWLQPLLTSGIGKMGLVIDRDQRLRGVGNLSDVSRYDAAVTTGWPFRSNLAYLQYEVQGANAQAVVNARLRSDGATVVPLWQGETLAAGFAEVDVTLPSAAQLQAFDTLEVEVTLGCPDAEAVEVGNCGAWDYLARLTAPGSGSAELARFITSYHRESHWVVDATPLLPLLAAGGVQRLRWDFAPSWNTQPTRTWISLRFSNRARGMRPVSAIRLFGGGDFGATYDVGRTPIGVPVPAAARRVELVAIVTGHGAGTNQCAEFCSHQHEFTVRTSSTSGTHRLEFPDAGSQTGCIAQVVSGTTPNQAGTWWYGRGGWCPGQQVTPHVFDVTADVIAGGAATVEYRGLYAGAPPPDGSGTIDLASWLVVYE